MGYQALLFCPDEKLARVVSQVFGELDFSVDLVVEPFAAVKKLMAQRFDAIVVDCDNEQNASLLFKSARNSASNQSSLAIAVVEGQVGVAKAYRIGANLVLTKPINVEQAKGTLRVARGLLRKSSDAPASSVPAQARAAVTQSAAQSASLVGVPFAASSSYEAPEIEAPIGADVSQELPAMAASATVPEKAAALPETAQSRAWPELDSKEIASAGNGAPKFENNAENEPASKTSTPAISFPAAIAAPASTPSFGAAAAPAPAKEIGSTPAPKKTLDELTIVEPSIVNPSPDSSRGQASAFGSGSTSSAAPVATSPVDSSSLGTTSFGTPSLGSPSFGSLGDEASVGSGGSKKKFLIAAAVILVLGVSGYFILDPAGKAASSAPTPAAIGTRQASAQNVGALSPPVSTAAISPSGAADPGNALAQDSSAKGTLPTIQATASPTLNHPSASVPPGIGIAATSGPSNSLPTAKPAGSAPLLVKSSGQSSPGQSEDSAPVLATSASAASVNSNLSGLMPVSSNISNPTLATVKISQGVSQGLVIKRVQPKYPEAALAVRTQGTVQIEATVSKDGTVTNAKVLNGDPVLARAALDAVKQWRYKPYYLDGQPVEIQTQISVNFKAD